jgi:hypothetical protein
MALQGLDAAALKASIRSRFAALLARWSAALAWPEVAAAQRSCRIA